MRGWIFCHVLPDLRNGEQGGVLDASHMHSSVQFGGLLCESADMSTAISRWAKRAGMRVVHMEVSWTPLGSAYTTFG